MQQVATPSQGADVARKHQKVDACAKLFLGGTAQILTESLVLTLCLGWSQQANNCICALPRLRTMTLHVVRGQQAL